MAAPAVCTAATYGFPIGPQLTAVLWAQSLKLLVLTCVGGQSVLSPFRPTVTSLFHGVLGTGATEITV